MADASSTLDKARSLIEDRLKELDEERTRLERALADLKGTRRGPGRPRGSGNGRRRSTGGAGGNGRRRRRRRGGTRAEQALKHIEENPGIRASEIASKMNIKPNYVYRVMSELQQDGRVAKEGRGYSVASGASSGGSGDEASGEASS